MRSAFIIPAVKRSTLAVLIFGTSLAIGHAAKGPAQAGSPQNPVQSGKTTAPVLTKTTEPQYTEEAKKNRVQGVVVVSTVVGIDGLVHESKIVRGLGHGLDEMAIKAIQDWRFRPATRNGQPVATTVTVEVSFRLSGMDIPPSHLGEEKIYSVGKGIRPPKPLQDPGPDLSHLPKERLRGR